MATATALDASTIVRIEKATMIRVLHDESSFIHYNGRMEVHSSLLNIVLHD
jgi:hypothetical protein